MKILYIALSALVLSCLVQDGSCGVVSDVYGNVRNKTVALKDGVKSWMTYGKDWVLGTNSHPIEARTEREMVENDSMLSSIYNNLLSGFQSARDNVYGFFVSDENRKNNGFINSMYNKVKNRITMITAYVVGEDPLEKPKEAGDISEVRRVLNQIINHKNKNQLKEGVESLKDKAGEANEKLHDEIDQMKETVDNLHLVGEQVGKDTITASDSVSKVVNDAKDSFTSTLAQWQQSGIEISEKEREVLNALSSRIRNKIKSVNEAIGDPKHLSYPEVVTKEN